MNMHGVMVPQGDTDTIGRRNSLLGARDWLAAHRMFLLVVVLPTLLASAYYFLIAADQYESEAHFLVRTTNPGPMPATGISQALSAATGLSAAQNESQSVADYLTSHDVVASLQHDLNLVSRFRRPEADMISRLSAEPTPERLLSYYQDKVAVHYNTESGITTLNVRSFRPADSYEILEALLKLGEARVNVLNERGYRDTLAQAQEQLGQTEEALAVSQSRLTSFRQVRRDVDPQASGAAQIGLVSKMSAELSAARAQLASMGSAVSHTSPQYIAVLSRIRAMEAQFGSQSNKLTGTGQAIAADIGGYEDLRMRQQFLAKRYDAAAANLDRARDQALRQQLYVVRVVEPNMPVKSTYPKRFRVLGTVLIGLLLLYAIGWLIGAGMKEHAA